jgi:hypothetical protein
MFNRDIMHFRPQLLVTFLVVFGLVFAGVRVPDLSRPHRPKPTHRVVLENHHKSCSDHLKQCGDIVAVVAKPPTSCNPVWYRAETRLSSPRYLSPLFFPHSGRSPPIALS